MKRTLLAGVAITALLAPIATASAQAVRYHHRPADVAAPLAGAAVGTGVGLAISEGAFTGSLGAALPATAAGAAAFGGIAGVGTAVLIHASVTPCQGFQALFGNLFTDDRGCVNGQWVGDRPVAVERTVVRSRRR